MKKKQAEQMLRADAIATAIDMMRENLKLKRLLTLSIVVNAFLGCIIVYFLL